MQGKRVRETPLPLTRQYVPIQTHPVPNTHPLNKYPSSSSSFIHSIYHIQHHNASHEPLRFPSYFLFLLGKSWRAIWALWYIPDDLKCCWMMMRYLPPLSFCCIRCWKVIAIARAIVSTITTLSLSLPRCRYHYHTVVTITTLSLPSPHCRYHHRTVVTITIIYDCISNASHSPTISSSSSSSLPPCHIIWLLLSHSLINVVNYSSSRMFLLITITLLRIQKHSESHSNARTKPRTRPIHRDDSDGLCGRTQQDRG